MKKTFIFLISLVWFVLNGCTAQDVQPIVPVYNITITQTDNSQHLTGDNNKAEVKPVTTTKAVAEIKPEVTSGAEATTKNNMWIFYVVLLFTVIGVGWFLLKKYKII